MNGSNAPVLRLKQRDRIEMFELSFLDDSFPRLRVCR